MRSLIIIISLLIVSFSCNTNSPKLTKEEKHDLICNHFISNIKADSFQIFHRKLFPLDIQATYPDSIYLFEQPSLFFPRLDSNSWKNEGLKCINIIEKEDLDFFMHNIHSDTSKFQIKVISEPIFNPNNKIAAIAYSRVNSKISLGCIPNDEFEILRFIKTKNGWNKID